MSTPNRISIATQLLAIAFSLSVLAARTAQAQSNPATPPASPFHEDLLAEISPGAEVKLTYASNHHLAWVENLSGKRTVRLDAKKQGGEYDDVQRLEISRDESHFVFSGKRGSEWIFVLDGQEHANGYTYIASAAFQPGGTSIAYTACKEKKCHLIVDGAETGAEYEEISYPRYSPDGKRIAFLAKQGKKWIAVVDGKQLGPELDQVAFTSWGFSRSGTRFYCTGREKNIWLHVVDGTSTPGFEAISRLAFSRDGEHYAYGGADAKGGLKKQKVFGTIIKDGQPVANYEGKGMMGELSALGGAREIMLGGVHELRTDFHGVSTPEFNPDGQLVYAARRDKGDVAVFVGADAGPGFDEVLSPVIFAEDSRHFAFIARQGGDFVEVRDNKPVLTIPAGKRGATEVGWIAISLDASHLAYETVSGGRNFKAAATLRAYRTAVLDGKPGQEYNALGINSFGFDPDSHHFFYEVIGAEADRDLVNVDGHESRLYDTVTNIRYLSDGKSVAFVARDGSRFLGVTFALSSSTSLPTVSTASNATPTPGRLLKLDSRSQDERLGSSPTPSH